MRIEEPLVEARLLRRYKRFLADVELADGSALTVHCANPGRLIGCLPEGAPVVLRDSGNPLRKLRYTLLAIRVGRAWVGVDTGLANAVVDEALAQERIPELAGYASRRREVRYGRASRIDFLLEDPDRAPCFLEVKQTTWVERGLARFPDAVTERGAGHLEELARVAAGGERAAVLFVVSRSDARRFEPADAIDPRFGRALRDAVEAGVELFAYAARIEPGSIALRARVPIELPALEPARRSRHSDTPYSSEPSSG